MQIMDLQNLIVLARKGIASIAANLSAAEGAAAYASIGAAETFVNNLVEQQKQQQKQQEEAQAKFNEMPNVKVIEVTQQT
jgi:hypothetical protein